METKNNEWSVEGDYYLLKAFKDKVEESGLKFCNIRWFEDDYKKGYRYLHCCNFSNVFNLWGIKTKNHFKLPEQWNEALEFILGKEKKEEDYKEGDWVWVEPEEYSEISKKQALVAYKKYDSTTYGFDFSGEWTEGFSLPEKTSFGKIVSKATPEEVENALWKEWERRCKKKGIDDPKNAKIEKHADNDLCGEINKGYFLRRFDDEDNKLWNCNGIVFYKGNWAEPKVENELTFGGHTVYLKSTKVSPKSKDDIEIGCNGETDTLNKIDEIISYIIEMENHPKFGTVYLNKIGDVNIDQAVDEDTTIMVGCLFGTYKELLNIQKEGHKLLRNGSETVRKTEPSCR